MKKSSLTRELFLILLLILGGLNQGVTQSSSKPGGETGSKPAATAGSKPSPKPAPKTAKKPVVHLKSYVVEREGSEIGFEVKTTLKDLKGTFGNWTANLKMDPAKLDTLSLVIVAQGASADTGLGLQDREIKGENFFWVEKYPQLMLVSKKIVTEGSNHLMDADFTLRGCTHAVVIRLNLEVSGKAGQAQGNFEFNRKDFGITHNIPLNKIHDMIRVHLNLKFHESPAKGVTAAKAKSPSTSTK
jgi:polyisoprenoid-binding protein YceI